MTNLQYVVNSPQENENCVDAWSIEYIPFEPKDWRRDMREEMKKAIEWIAPSNGCLYAAYVSDSMRFCDVENVLFYNIGAPAFDRLSKFGVCFEHGFCEPPSAPALSKVMRHHYHYSQGNEFRLWEEKDTIATWHDVLLPTLRSTSKPHVFWYALKKGRLVERANSVPLTEFGLSIQLDVPENAWCNLAALTKPLLDGVISVFHQQSAPCDPTMLQRLADLTGCEAAELQCYLCEKATAALGQRPVISAFRQGVKWNPGDDACFACRVTVNRAPKNTNWSMSGKLFSIQIANQPHNQSEVLNVKGHTYVREN